MLHGRLLGSPLPHARIKNIDTSRAEKLPGVKLVMTHKDIPEGCGVGRRARLLRPAPSRFVGPRCATWAISVVAVVAISEDIAVEALDLIDVDYEELPAVFDPREAMQEGAHCHP